MGADSILRSEKVAQIMMMPDGAMLKMKQSHANGAELIIRAQGWFPGKGDNFTGRFISDARDVEQDIDIFWNEPASEWIGLLAIVIALVFFDAWMAKKLVQNDNVSSWKAHAYMVTWWIFCGIGYNVFYGVRHGRTAGIDWFIGYILEWMLSLDNLFAFQFIIRTYGAPEAIQHKALFYGVLGTLITRLLLFFAIGTLMHSIHYVQLVFGIILIYAGVQSLRDDDEETHPDELLFVRVLKRCLGSRLRDSYDLVNHQLFVFDAESNRWCATLLVPLICCVEVTDVIFAVDSVSAKVAQIPNQYIAYSSSVMALLGLRAMYFVIDDLVRYYTALKYGVCFILVFIGGELMISGKFQLPDWIVCMVIVTVFNLCIVFSLLQKVINDMTSPMPEQVAESAAAGDDDETGGKKEGGLLAEAQERRGGKKERVLAETEELNKRLMRQLRANETMGTGGSVGSTQRSASASSQKSGQGSADRFAALPSPSPEAPKRRTDADSAAG